MNHRVKYFFIHVLLKQGIILVLAIGFFVIPVATDIYLGRHVIRPCKIDRIPLCDYDTNFSGWLNGVEYNYSQSSFSHQVRLFEWQLARATKPYDAYLPSIIELLILIVFYNSIWLLISFVTKMTRKEQSKSKASCQS